MWPKSFNNTIETDKLKIHIMLFTIPIENYSKTVEKSVL